MQAVDCKKIAGTGEVLPPAPDYGNEEAWFALRRGGTTATDYLIPAIGREGNYLSREIWLYRDSIRGNMALRARLHARKTGILQNHEP